MKKLCGNTVCTTVCEKKSNDTYVQSVQCQYSLRTTAQKLYKIKMQLIHRKKR